MIQVQVTRSYRLSPNCYEICYDFVCLVFFMTVEGSPVKVSPADEELMLNTPFKIIDHLQVILHNCVFVYFYSPWKDDVFFFKICHFFMINNGHKDNHIII